MPFVDNLVFASFAMLTVHFLFFREDSAIFQPCAIRIAAGVRRMAEVRRGGEKHIRPQKFLPAPPDTHPTPLLFPSYLPLDFAPTDSIGEWTAISGQCRIKTSPRTVEGKGGGRWGLSGRQSLRYGGRKPWGLMGSSLRPRFRQVLWLYFLVAAKGRAKLSA